MGFTANLSYNLSQIDTKMSGGLRTFFQKKLQKLYNLTLFSFLFFWIINGVRLLNTEFSRVSLPIGRE